MEKVRFLVVVSGHNCSAYVKGCLDSIKAQTYTNYDVSIQDDASTDGTIDLIRENALPSWSYGQHYERSGMVMCRDFQVKVKEGFDVIVWVDMDDQLEPNALERVAKEYEDKDCWLTMGSWSASNGFKYTPEFMDIPFRYQDLQFTHLRTFKKELYRHLTKEDLYPEHREIYPDANMLYCLLELAGIEHIRIIPDIIYRYNTNNPLSVIRRFTPEQRADELSFIKSLPPKQKLNSL